MPPGIGSVDMHNHENAQINQPVGQHTKAALSPSAYPDRRADRSSDQCANQAVCFSTIDSRLPFATVRGLVNRSQNAPTDRPQQVLLVDVQILLGRLVVDQQE